MRSDPAPRTLLLGLGNLLCGDDGLGVVALERLRRDYTWPTEVELLDGGTLGLSLLPMLEDADEVFILDAVQAEAPPGSLVHLDGEEVEPALRERLSCHQVGVADLLDALHWRGTWPRRVRVLGLVPDRLELQVGLSPAVAAGLDALLAATLRELERAGQRARPRNRDAVAASDALDHAGLARALGL